MKGIPHLLTCVVTDMKDAANALGWCVAEMERRYKLMSALGCVTSRAITKNPDGGIHGTADSGSVLETDRQHGNDASGSGKEPYIVVMVDEFADLMMTAGKKWKNTSPVWHRKPVQGIHLVLATQRPSVDVITGLIKANIPTRISPLPYPVRLTHEPSSNPGRRGNLCWK